MRLTIQTPGKINLYLRVAGKRSDGFHELETLFIPIPEFSDTLDVELTDDGDRRLTVRSDHFSVPDGPANIAYKAARLFLDELGSRHSVAIRIQKRIPVAAGMGGGSSDAAAVILALTRLLGELPDCGRAIALKCGADVPYFLNPVPMIGRGLGEILEPAEGLILPEIRIRPPNFPVSAAWAYRHFSPANDSRKLSDLMKALRSADFKSAAAFVRNDLEPAVRAKFPILQLMETRIRKAGADCVRMTGSGPTLFAF